jgi:hypothetical protein
MVWRFPTALLGNLTGKGRTMNSMPVPEPSEGNSVFVTNADDQLVRAYRQMSVDEQLAHVAQELSKLGHDAAPHPQPARGRRGLRRSPALRGLTGLLVASCIFAAAFGQSSSYGETAKLTMSQWAPQLRSTPFMGKPEPNPQSSPSAIQLAQAELQVLQPTTSTETAKRVTDRITPDLVQLFQVMARDLMTVEQKIEQLRARQNQMADDNAKVVEQLKASQEQMARLIATASEENSAHPLQPTTAAAR